MHAQKSEQETVHVSLDELDDMETTNGIIDRIESGSIGRLVIHGDGKRNAQALGVLLDTEPGSLTSSSDIPVTVNLRRGNSLFVTFGGYRFMDRRRLTDWLTMLKTGSIKDGCSDIGPSTGVLPRLSRTRPDQ